MSTFNNDFKPAPDVVLYKYPKKKIQDITKNSLFAPG